MKILYLTFLESVTRNGIYDTQVKEVLCKLASDYEDQLAICHIAFLPAVRIGRKGISAFLRDEKLEAEKLKKEYLRHGVAQECVFLPLIALRRWGAQLGFVPLALLTVYSTLVIARRTARQRPDVIHCRSYMATVIALCFKCLFPGVRVVFDPRGFWPEEGVVEGSWKADSWTFRLWKKIEAYLFTKSDRIIALSDSFADHIRSVNPNANCDVIHTSVDVDKFRKFSQAREQNRRELNLDGNHVFVYNGSLGSWHDPALLARVYLSLQRTLGDARLLVLTTHNKEKLDEIFLRNGLQPCEFMIRNAKPGEVAGYLAAADYGIVPLRDIDPAGPMAVVANTMIGTKVAEYLASGLPIVVNRNVRGIQSLLARFKVGLSFDSDDLEATITRVSELVEHRAEYQQNCTLVAEHFFSLHRVTRAYFEVYEELAGAPSEIRPRAMANSMKNSTFESQDIAQMPCSIETRLEQ